MLRICAISDCHSHLPPHLPKGDVLVMAGDMEPEGCPESQANWMHYTFRKWLNRVAGHFSYKLFIGGNHTWWTDEWLRERFSGTKGPYTELIRSLGITVLFNEGITIDNHLFFGSFYCNKVGRWNYGWSEEEWAINLQRWPKPDVLITHGPPNRVLDNMLRTIINEDGSRSTQVEYTGSIELYKWIEKNKPKLHIFGHIHPHQGSKKINWNDSESTVFVNAAQVNDNRDTQFNPIEIFLFP